MPVLPLRPVGVVCLVGLIASAGLLSCADPETPISPVSVFSYGPETVERDRSQNIALRVARTYGSTEAEDEGALYIPLHVDFDADGNVFVSDNGHKAIVVFSEAGEFLRRIGRPGQGPGEFTVIRGMAVAGGAVYALGGPHRLSVWSTDGTLLRDVHTPLLFRSVEAFDDATLVVTYGSNDFADTAGYESVVIAGYRDTVDGLQETNQYVTIPQLSRVSSTPPVDLPDSIFALAGDGIIYWSETREYEVTASAESRELWRLRVAVEPERVTDEDVDDALSHARIPVTRSSYTWPETFPVLRYMAVDGHGHLYVYPWMRRRVRNLPSVTTVPVDVFDRSGKHIFSGTIDKQPWFAGRGDLVYAIDEDEASGGRVVVAYELIEPFSP